MDVHFSIEKATPCTRFSDCLLIATGKMNNFLNIMFGGDAWTLYEIYAAILSFLAVIVYVVGAYETSVFRIDPGGTQNSQISAEWTSDCEPSRNPWAHHLPDQFTCDF